MLIVVDRKTLPDTSDMFCWQCICFFSVPFRLVPESFHWLMAKKKYKEADQWIRKQSKLSRKHIDLSQCIEDDNITKKRRETTKAPRRTIFDLFKSPILLWYCVCCFVNCTSAMMVYWGMSLMSTQLHSDRYIGYFASGLIEIPAGIMGPLLLIKFGRKTVMFISQILCAVSFFCVPLLPDGEDELGVRTTTSSTVHSPGWQSLVLWLIAKYGNIMIFPPIWLLMSELFPTSVRWAKVCSLWPEEGTTTLQKL